jgi:hypothetical protein
MAMNFPANPSPGDTYVVGTATWRYNGAAWDKLAISPTLQTYTAGTNLSGHRAVKIHLGTAVYCDAASASDAGKAIGITTGAALQGEQATVQIMAQMTEPSWTWTEGPVYVGAAGGLTQTVTDLAFIQQIGVAGSATSIDINPQLSILTQ